VSQQRVAARPLIAVRDVRASSRWYAAVLGAEGLPEHEHRNVYDRISCAGSVVLQVHAWDEEDHPNLVNAAAAPPGHGVVLWFRVDDFAAAAARAHAIGAVVLQGPQVNPNSGADEMWLRDADGYVVVIAGPDGEGGAGA
jgi:catechol 2,3-dioxygenase-like lactoylglutathione lyase family enzyme